MNMKLVRLVKESRLKEWSPTRRVVTTQRGNEDTDQEDAGSKIQNKRKALQLDGAPTCLWPIPPMKSP